MLDGGEAELFDIGPLAASTLRDASNESFCLLECPRIVMFATSTGTVLTGFASSSGLRRASALLASVVVFALRLLIRALGKRGIRGALTLCVFSATLGGSATPRALRLLYVIVVRRSRRLDVRRPAARLGEPCGLNLEFPMVSIVSSPERGELNRLDDGVNSSPFLKASRRFTIHCLLFEFVSLPNTALYWLRKLAMDSISICPGTPNSTTAGMWEYAPRAPPPDAHSGSCPFGTSKSHRLPLLIQDESGGAVRFDHNFRSVVVDETNGSIHDGRAEIT